MSLVPESRSEGGAAGTQPALLMSRKVFLRFSMLAGSILLNYTGTPASAQTTPASAQTQSPASTMSDPTRPEIQRDLSIDRDPVPSPDPVAIPPAGAGAPLVQKGQDRIYTLQRDVDEVLLQCTVVDEHGRLVTDLNRDDFRVWEDGAPQTIASLHPV
jgi:Ca-activated chloride channel homolog